ncbi:GNAT family N-acetyltransferase [Methylobacterium sp. WL103]|uniref:GNAT family N-acetyltransferase n=1 Tax=Methylobacterium sp. WL103 TaxID=2603891 RepID=UPI0011C9225A|nr:GNAT family N-acetyltransferase [Methylobacterium sp. WL103]TXN00230.1 GNAT family N-acetyltransferase [Methylobacterium sp. WL103]
MSTEARARSLEIVRLTSADAAVFRELRLEGLRDHPEAFGASWEDEATHSEAQFSSRLDDAVVFGARSVDGMRLDGIVGVYRPEAAKTKHKAVIWGMYVRLRSRRAGVGAILLKTAIDHASLMVEEVNLTVGLANAAALKLYESAGFKRYGVEQRALKIGEQYYDEVLMSLLLSKR